MSSSSSPEALRIVRERIECVGVATAHSDSVQAPHWKLTPCEYRGVMELCSDPEFFGWQQARNMTVGEIELEGVELDGQAGTFGTGQNGL